MNFKVLTLEKHPKLGVLEKTIEGEQRKKSKGKRKGR